MPSRKDWRSMGAVAGTELSLYTIPGSVRVAVDSWVVSISIIHFESAELELEFT